MWIPLIVVAVGIVMMLVELLKPGRSWPHVTGWWLRAICFNALQAALVWIAGIAWDTWMQEHSLLSIASLGTIGSSIVGYLILTFVYYWWHRARHESSFLWRWFHQFHHSPQRLEVITSFYKHPLEITANALLSSLVMFLLLGLSPAGAAGATLLSGLAELFYHWNVNTPRWIGFLFQRPESHCVHHERGKHHYNYGDLPLWDMLFGTFLNPYSFEQQCGFEPDAELRIKDMMLGKDVQEPLLSNKNKHLKSIRYNKKSAHLPHSSCTEASR